jgi:hypothetical protein
MIARQDFDRIEGATAYDDGAHRKSPGVLIEIPHPRAVVTVAVLGDGRGEHVR